MHVLEILIDFDAVSVHQVQNFGETLFHAFADGRIASVSLAEVDRATDQLRVVIGYPSKRRVRKALNMIAGLLEEHLLSFRARLSRNDKSD